MGNDCDNCMYKDEHVNYPTCETCLETLRKEGVAYSQWEPWPSLDEQHVTTN